VLVGHDWLTTRLIGKSLAVLDASVQGQTNVRKNQINVVLNWFTELQQRVPVK